MATTAPDRDALRERMERIRLSQAEIARRLLDKNVTNYTSERALRNRISLVLGQDDSANELLRLLEGEVAEAEAETARALVGADGTAAAGVAQHG